MAEKTKKTKAEEAAEARKAQLKALREAPIAPGNMRVELDKKDIEPISVDYPVGATLNDALQAYGPDVVYACYREGAHAAVRRELFRITGKTIGMSTLEKVAEHIKGWVLGTDPTAQKKVEKAASVINNLDPAAKYEALLAAGVPKDVAHQTVYGTPVPQ